MEQLWKLLDFAQISRVVHFLLARNGRYNYSWVYSRVVERGKIQHVSTAVERASTITNGGLRSMRSLENHRIMRHPQLTFNAKSGVPINGYQLRADVLDHAAKQIRSPICYCTVILKRGCPCQTINRVAGHTGHE